VRRPGPFAVEQLLSAEVGMDSLCAAHAGAAVADGSNRVRPQASEDSIPMGSSFFALGPARLPA
jgi:hypothetical protein